MWYPVLRLERTLLVMCSLRISGPFILSALLTTALSLPTHGQSPHLLFSIPAPTTIPVQAPAPADFADKLPNEPAPPITTRPVNQPSGGIITSNGIIIGTVFDTNGAEITDALVTLENTDSKTQRTLTTDSTGSFKFEALEAGNFNLTITSTGFSPWVSSDLALNPGQSFALPPVALQIASAMTDVEVTVTQHDIAEDEMHFAEKQRVLGIFPNFYASYISNAAPLSSGQKFRLALITSADPVSIVIPGVIAAIEQSQNSYAEYGQGAQGFAKRFGASSADSLISTMITDAILPSVLHQDPRYFYKGTGSIRARALYAVATVFICKGDNSHWQPNYSNVLGNLASAGLSNLYYPSTDRGARLTIDNWLIGNASGAAGSLFQEFLVKKISRGIHHPPPES
jgi:hypothetical protein